MIAEFDLPALSPSPAIFDQGKLDWLDHEYIMALDPVEHERMFAAHLPAGTPPQACAALAAAFQPSLVAYGRAAGLAAEVLDAPEPGAARSEVTAAAGPQLRHLRDLRALAPEWLAVAGARDLLAEYRAWGNTLGIAARDLLLPLRVALTGREHGPELPFVLAALDVSETLSRLDQALSAASGPTIHAAPPTQGEQP